MVVATLAMSWNNHSKDEPEQLINSSSSLENGAPHLQHIEIPLSRTADGSDDLHRCRRATALVASEAAVVSSQTDGDCSTEFVDVNEATVAINNLVIGRHHFVASSPQKSGCSTELDTTPTGISGAPTDLGLITDWDILSPPSNEPTSPNDEGVVLNSADNSHSLTSSIGFSTCCSVSCVSSPLSASSASQYTSSYTTDSSGSASKKRVRFADAHGKPLAVVCTFANSPIGSYDSANNTPVATTLSRIFNLVQSPGHNATGTTYQCGSSSKDPDCMEVLFPDPLCDYTALTQKLQTNNVALESVCCRGGFIKGMIRVRNLSFSKHVFVRTSFDQWSSSADWSADFFPIIAATDGPSVYDLFEFSIPIPPHLMPGTIIEFCICYKCGDQSGEYWDNNNDKNFSLRYRPLSGVGSAPKGPSVTPAFPSVKGIDLVSPKCYRLNAEVERAQRIRDFVWSEFASWNGGSAMVGNNPSSSVPAMRVVGAVTTTTSPAGKDVPYW